MDCTQVLATYKFLPWCWYLEPIYQTHSHNLSTWNTGKFQIVSFHFGVSFFIYCVLVLVIKGLSIMSPFSLSLNISNQVQILTRRAYIQTYS